MADEQPKKIMYQERRMIPQSSLDAEMIKTNPVWGKQEISPGLNAALTKRYIYADASGAQQTYEDPLWERLSYYTRDLRMANISRMTGEFKYCTYYLDLAGDLIQEGHRQAAVVCLSRVATQLELSQSVGGFLRKTQARSDTEQIINRELEPPKKSFFSGGKKKEGY